MLSYIYKFTNVENGNVYIGQSINPHERYKQHFYGTSPFDMELRRLGADAFTFEVIERTTMEEVNNREIYWIDFYDSYFNGYNRTIGGSGIYRPKQVHCIELNTTFNSINQAANAVAVSGGTAGATTTAKHITKALNSLEDDVYGFHFCSPELKDIYLEDLEYYKHLTVGIYHS